MAQLICQEFDEFEESLRGVQGRYVLRERQQRDWRLRVVELDGVTVMAGREGAANVYHGVGLSQCFNIFLPLGNPESVVVDGRGFDERTIGWMAPDLMFHIRAGGPTSWLTVAMSAELVMRWASAHEDEFDFSVLRRNLVNNVSQDTAALMWLASSLLQVDARASEDLHTPAAEAAARAEVLNTVFHTLLPVNEDPAPPQRASEHMRILSRSLGLLESMGDRDIHAEDLCAVTGASERTVRNVFRRYLGISPHQYLMVRRLNAIRTALCRAGPGETVTGICARYGVWEFGRFSSQYRHHFGELPSQSLHDRQLSLP
jgi:AraC family ethanolamine operon transcriptional activator